MSSLLSRLVNLAGQITGTLPVANGGTGVTTSTGSGNVVLSTSPTLVTPALGTPASGTLTNCTGYPVVVPGTSSGLVSASGLTGNTTGSAISVGFVGEKIEALQSSFASAGATATFFDMGNVPLTAGVWSISYLLVAKLNGATMTFFSGGIGTASSTNSAGLTYGVTQADSMPPTSAGINTSLSIPNYIVSISFSTTYYGKCYFSYSAGTPQYAGRLTAVRIA